MFVNISSGATTSLMEPSRVSTGYKLKARKLAEIALANLSGALTGIYQSLQVQDMERALSLQLQECAAMALANLAQAKENSRKIVNFGITLGLTRLANVLFQDDNPGGQEYAAWALAKLSHYPHDSKDIVVKICDFPNIVRGLARLLQLPTSGSTSRIRMQEQSVRALANLTYTHRNQVKIARVPNVIAGLAAVLLSRHCHQNLNPTIQDYVARAIANLVKCYAFVVRIVGKHEFRL